MSEQNRKDFKDDELWKILGRSRPREPGPFFTYKTLLAARQAAAKPRPFFHLSLLATWPQNAISGACIIILVLSFLFFWSKNLHSPPGHSMSSANAGQIRDDFSYHPSADEEVELIKDLDILLALEENSVWTEVF